MLLPVILIRRQLPDDDSDVRLRRRLEQLLQPHQPLVVLVQDGVGAPAETLYQLNVGLGKKHFRVGESFVYGPERPLKLLEEKEFASLQLFSSFLATLLRQRKSLA